jgi:hypothetical protein
MRADVEQSVQRQLAKAKADKYISRSGGAPGLRHRSRLTQSQQLMEDDRKALKYSVKLVRDQLYRRPDETALAAWDFIELLLDRDYGLSLGRETDVSYD